MSLSELVQRRWELTYQPRVTFGGQSPNVPVGALGSGFHERVKERKREAQRIEAQKETDREGGREGERER